ncbi:type I restriction endonuclease [Streptomyces antimycoticus]|uniref:type I restriction endonuclease n=1 Tax=Streptomyces antimycoticus TaxID=68175 RepID=UPI00343F3B47
MFRYFCAHAAERTERAGKGRPGLGRPGRGGAEKPLITLLTAMGWSIHGCPPSEAAGASGLCGECFRRAVRRINLDASGNPWLTGRQLDSLWSTALGSGRETNPSHLLAGNFEAAGMLRTGLPARALPGWRPGLPETVQLVDWDDASPGDNDFRLVLRPGPDGSVALAAEPDLVLSVNGLPWVVVAYEPTAHGVMGFLIDRIRNSAGTSADQPVPEYVRFGQLLVAMDAEDARLGTVTSEPRTFAAWRTVTPATEERVWSELGCAEPRPLRPWETLVAGTLRPSHLLGLVRNCVSEEGAGVRAKKWVTRYPQLRAAYRVAEALAARLRALEAGLEPDNRVGAVWHFGDSERDRTMGLVARHLRAQPELAGHKIVMVTNRAERAYELAQHLSTLGEAVHMPSSVREAERLLTVDLPDIVVLTIQKVSGLAALEERDRGFVDPPFEEGRHFFRVLNSSERIVVFVDDAQRFSPQYISLLAALPNAALLGFVGFLTPRQVFGRYIDIYTARDAIADGVVAPLVCETYEAGAESAERETGASGSGRGRSPEGLDAIEAKAAHMVRRWATGAMRDGYGAQVVVASRRAADRYCSALLRARNRLIAELDDMDPTLVYDPEFDQYATDDEKRLLELRKFRHVLESMDVAAVFSGERHDPPEWRRWTSARRQQANIMSFRHGIVEVVRQRQPDPSWEADPHGSPRKSGSGGSSMRDVNTPASDGDLGPHDDTTRPRVAFMVVVSRILSGARGPAGQMLFLDRRITVDELQQIMRLREQPGLGARLGAIGRPVVNYTDIRSVIVQTLDGYDPEHLEDVLGGPDSPGSLLMKESGVASGEALWRLHSRIRGFLRSHGVAWSLAAEPHREDLLAVLAEPLAHVEFTELVRDFLTTLNEVMPAFEGEQYQELAGWLGIVLYLAWQRYPRDSQYLEPRSYGAMVDDLIEQRMERVGTREVIPPAKITVPDFLNRVRMNDDPRARVAYLTVALRTHADGLRRTEPLRHARFAERLDRITARADEDFERAADHMASLVREALAFERDYVDDTSELDRWTEAPVYRLLKAAVEETGPVSYAFGDPVREAARDVARDIAEWVRPPQFVVLATTRNRVRRELRQALEERVKLDWEVTGPLAGRLLELAVESRAHFLRYGEGDGASH